MLAVTTWRRASIADSQICLADAVRAADQLDHDVGIGLARHGDRIVEPAHGAKIDAAVLGAVARRDRDDLERPAAAHGQQLGLVAQQRQRARADGAEAGDADPELRHYEATARLA